MDFGSILLSVRANVKDRFGFKKPVKRFYDVSDHPEASLATNVIISLLGSSSYVFNSSLCT